MSDYVIPDHCQFCEDEPTQAFNDIAVCEAHTQEGIAAAVKVMAAAQGIEDPQRTAAMEETLVETFEEHGAEMNTVGDEIVVNTGYDPGAN